VATLSVAILCKNSEATIGLTLESVAGLGAEIVAVDSGSTDGTIALLERHGARVIRAEWRGYIATRQMAMDACAGEWVLALDSDESLLPELRESVRAAVVRDDPGVHGFLVNRKVFYRDRPLNFAWQPERRLRLVRRGHARSAGMEPHEHIALTLPSPTPLLAGDLRHDTIPSFGEFLAKQASHARIHAASMLREGKRGSYWKLVTSPPGAFLKQLVLKQAWRDGWPGWLAAASTAASALMKHAVLIELSRQDRS
jgi:glycosyltransferase involved in cell wall biosynthesis